MTPFVLGIAGGTASGKSTVARALAEALGDVCLHIVHDRYYHSMPDEFKTRPTTYNFDHPEALDTARLVSDLTALRAGQPAHLPVYDFASHSRGDSDELVEPRPVILVEGILVFSPADLRDLMHKRAWVEAPVDVRLMRRIRRDMRSRGRTADSVLDQYERTVRPMHEAFVAPSRRHAHLTLDGTGALAHSVRTLQALLPGGM